MWGGNKAQLALPPTEGKIFSMASADLSRAALELPADERLELARRLVESAIEPASLTEAITEGIRRIEDVASGRVQGLTEEEYRAALR